MKKKLPIFLLLGISLAAAIGYRWSTHWRWQETTDDAYVETDITALSPKVSGHVVELAVLDHQAVKAGDLLLRVDDRDYRAKQAEAQAVLTARQAGLEQLQDRIAVQKALLQQARAGINAAQADVQRSQADLKRSQALVREDFVSRQMLDSRTADASKAQAMLSGSSAQVAGAERQLAVLDSERAIVAAQLEQARAQLALADQDVEATVIRAPVDGVIGNRAVQMGQYVRPGQHVLSLVALPRLWVDANFKETQLARMQVGQRVEIEVDSFPGHVLTGSVESFSPATGAKFSLLPPENATGNFTKVVQRVPVRIALSAADPLLARLRPGLSVTARVTTGP